MAIEVTLGELVAAVPGFQKLGGVKGLPLRAVYNYQKLVKVAEPELTGFDAAKRKLFEELGEPSEDGKSRSIPADKIEAFLERIRPLLEQKVKLEVSPVDLPADLDTSELSANDLGPLMPFVELAGNGETKSEG